MSSGQRAPGLKNSISRGNIEKIKLLMQKEIFNREWIFHSEPLSGRRKTRPGLKFSSENENFKPRMKISSANGSFVRGGMVFFMRSSENELFRSPGPLGL